MTRAAIGVDLGGTHLRAARIERDPNGRCRRIGGARLRWRRDVEAGPEGALEDLSVALGEVLGELSGTRDEALPMGFAVAGQLDAQRRCVRNAPNIGWRDLALAERLEGRLGRRVTLVNDVQAAWRGERAAGAAQGVDEPVAAVFWGTGIGGAFGVGDHVWRGAGGTAGEIGHVKISGSDAPCGCGERGCVEATLGGRALERRLPEAGWPGGLPALERALVEGNPEARALVEAWLEPLACAVAAFCTLVAPGLLVLGGGVVTHAPGVARHLGSRAHALTLATTRAGLRVATAQQADWAGVFGAAVEALVAADARPT